MISSAHLPKRDRWAVFIGARFYWGTVLFGHGLAAVPACRWISRPNAPAGRQGAADTPGWPLSANKTAALVTPARRAIPVMAGRFIRPPKLSYRRPSTTGTRPGRSGRAAGATG